MSTRIKIGTVEDFIKASRRGSREAEIEFYGKPLSHKKIFRNRKKYTRKLKHKDDLNILN